MPAKMRREWVDDWVPLLPAEGLSRQENGAGSGPAPSIPNPGARLARCRCAAGGLGDDRAVDGGGRLPVVTAAKQRKLDVILVWKLDRWGRSLVDLMTTLHELTALGVGFVSLTEALDLTTPAGRAFAGFLAVFAEFERDLIRERIKAGITDARKRGKAHGRPRATANDATQIRALAQQGFSQAAIARHLGLWRTSVRRVLVQQEET